MDVAADLLDKRRSRHALFFAHLALEKMLKAHVVKVTQAIPPRIHNLERLASIAGLKLTNEQTDLLLEFGAYQMEGRYPDLIQAPIDLLTTQAKLQKAKEMVQWLYAFSRLK